MKVAVIGCGKQGRRHLGALAGLPAVTGLVAADSDATRSRVAAELFSAAYSPVDAVFADSSIDAVVIATPTMTHLVIAAPGSHAAWKHRREQGGGAINELASHMVDLALWCFGPMPTCETLERSRSQTRRVVDGAVIAADAEDRIVMRLRATLGVAIDIEADFAAPRFSQWLEIRGEGGAVRASIEGAPDLYRLQAQSFLDAIAGNRGVGCDLTEAAHVSELLDRLNAAPAEVA